MIFFYYLMRLMRIDAGTFGNRCKLENIGTWPSLVARVSLAGMLTPKERQDQAKAWRFHPEALTRPSNHSWSFGDNNQELQEQMALDMGGGKSISFENYQEATETLMEKTWWTWCTTERPRSSSFQRPTCLIIGKGKGPSCQPWQIGHRDMRAPQFSGAQFATQEKSGIFGTANWATGKLGARSLGLGKLGLWQTLSGPN